MNLQINKTKFNLLIVSTILTMLITMNLAFLNSQTLVNNSSTPISSLLSTDYLNPTSLADDSLDIETSYVASLNYYYDTYTMSTVDYHLIWLTCTTSGDDFDLYLYQNSDFSGLIEDSTSGGDFDWIVYKPSTSTVVYPKVYAYYDGEGVIEAESAFDGNIGSGYTVCSGTYETGDIYEYYLSVGTYYNADLLVPSGVDMDLYCYYLSSGGAGDLNEYLYSSASSTTGVDESISFTASVSGTYAFVVIRKSGTSSGTLTITQGSSITTLSDDTSVYGNWPTQDIDYGYESYSLSTNEYHLFWLYYQNISNDMDLNLYSDISLTTLVEDSTRGDEVEWLVYYPSTYQSLYPAAYTDGGPNTGYIEVESGFDISVGNSHTEYLSPTDCADLVEVYLTTSNTYTIDLTVPATCDFDLYVFTLNSGTCTEVDLHSSTTTITGQDETITMTPTTSAYYAIVAIRRSGSGTSVIEVNYVRRVISGFEFIFLIFGIITAISISLIFYKKILIEA